MSFPPYIPTEPAAAGAGPGLPPTQDDVQFMDPVPGEAVPCSARPAARSGSSAW